MSRCGECEKRGNKRMNETGIGVVQDSIGRDWIICPECGKKTPGWGGGYGKRGNPSGICRWCGAEWEREGGGIKG